ncbi:LacI family DNA-binding transcriptional regulator [Microbacterium sp. NPDC057650]|uniref:LacI family DNA-binding transcriptional regulator n=1 Tax=unclassified Microbacterium TaxID=2609290 RepID=UPI00366AD8BC
MAKRVTIGQLAEELGLSKAATSYALRGSDQVSAETQRRAKELAAKRGWTPSAAARALTSPLVGAIGVVIRRDPRLLGNEPFFVGLIAGIEEELADTDDVLVLRMIGADGDREEEIYRRWGGERRVDGVLLFDDRLDDPRPSLVHEAGMTSVMLTSRDHGDGQGIVLDDPHGDAQLMLDHLAALGHRSVLHLSGPSALVHETERRAALNRVAAGHGMSVTSMSTDYAAEEGEELLARMLRENRPLSAVVASNDLLAVGAAKALEDAGRHDVAVVAWDDSLLCSLRSRPLTALARFPEERGRRGTKLLREILRGGEGRTVAAAPSELRVRATSTPAR